MQEKLVPHHRFHHVSTDEVYGSLGPDDPPFTENTPYAPNSPYAASKAASDHLVRAYHHTYGLDVTTTNCSNNYGPYQFPEKLIPLMILNSLRGKSLPIYGDGLNVRDWLSVSDHCRTIETVIDRGLAGWNYNVGGNCELTNLHVVETICAAVDSEFEKDSELARTYPACPAAKGASTCELISFVTDRLGHDRRYAIDAGRLRDKLGEAPSMEFNQGLQSTVSWFLGNRSWWQALLFREGGGHSVPQRRDANE
jgi:dTDP-glucose 4,6-dehydratase